MADRPRLVPQLIIMWVAPGEDPMWAVETTKGVLLRLGEHHLPIRITIHTTITSSSSSSSNNMEVLLLLLEEEEEEEVVEVGGMRSHCPCWRCSSCPW